MTTLLAVPNVSEGRDRGVVSQIADAFGSAAELLDIHTDSDHNRAVYSLGGAGTDLEKALVRGAGAALKQIDLSRQEGVHPRIGVVDVVPIVYARPEQQSEAEETARRTAERLASELNLPIFLYGGLATCVERSERAYFRNGGVAALMRRVDEEGLRSDFGPSRVDPRVGATLVTAREPLVAFNIELTSDDLGVAKSIAASLREDLAESGVRAVGLLLADRGVAQVSINVEQPTITLLGELVEQVSQLASRQGVAVGCAEIVGLVPTAALAGFPTGVEIRDFDPDRQILERRVE